jgi:hypothetical protein
MDPEVKRQLDLRLAKGEITREEYVATLKALTDGDKNASGSSVLSLASGAFNDWLTKLKDPHGDPTTVEVFECCINGQEIAPAYTEQNDPIEQRERLEHQAGGEQQKLDEDFLVALEHGMPPAGGMGMGIDRLCMMLLGQESIRDVILFPQLKPK